jgi:hypothetical protein
MPIAQHTAGNGGVDNMGIQHENADHGAEADSFREAIAAYETEVTKDAVVGDITVIEYINREGDAPFIKYRLTLEAIEVIK